MQLPFHRFRHRDRRRIASVAIVLLLASLASCGETGPTMSVEETALDLVERVEEATIAREHPEDPVAPGTFQTTVKKVGGKRFKGGERPAILAAPPSDVEFEIQVPPEAAFSFAAGVDETFHEAPVRVRFEADVDGRRIFETVLAPGSREGDRDWIEHREDLASLAGTTVRLRLRTTLVEPVPDNAPVRCGWGTPRVTTTRSIRKTRASARRNNVVYVVVDTLRADRLGCYGYERPTSPNLDGLAANGVAYGQPVSPSPWTWPSTASLLTGLYPYTHGVLNADRCYLPSAAVTVAEALRDAGVTTYAVSANPLVCRAQNFHQGFEQFEEAFHEGAGPVTDRFLAWLDENEESRFFAYLHYFDPHMPYRPPDLSYVEDVLGHPLSPEERSAYDAVASIRNVRDMSARGDEAGRIGALYDAEIRYWDTQFGRLLGELRQRGLDDRTMVVVTSDHGEELFDHGRIGHARTLYDELLMVPLVLALPGGIASGRNDAQVETVQIPATILALAEVVIPDFVEPSLPPPTDDGSVPSRSGFSTTERWENPAEVYLRTQVSLRMEGWKLIHAPATETRQEMNRLFSLEDDPAEQRDVSADHPDRTRDLRDRVVRWFGATKDASLKGDRVEVISPHLRKRLEELGYLERKKDRAQGSGE